MADAAKRISAALVVTGCSTASPLNNVGLQRCSRTGSAAARTTPASRARALWPISHDVEQCVDIQGWIFSEPY
jgi:hypothetical protein